MIIGETLCIVITIVVLHDLEVKVAGVVNTHVVVLTNIK